MTFAAWARRALRATRLALHIAHGLFICAVIFPWLDARGRRRAIQRWSDKVLRVLAVRLVVHGRPPPQDARPVMLVANHVSWLDIFAINAVQPVRFVAKSEVRRWPLIGWLCAQAGTIFIRRARRHDTARINVAVTAALLAGEIFAVFPEGTTTDGSLVLKFHSSLLEPALAARAAVQPVAIRYEREDGSLSMEVAYDGERTFLDTLFEMSRLRELAVRVWFLPPLLPTDRHRREIAFEAREAIDRTLRLADPGIRIDRGGGLPA